MRGAELDPAHSRLAEMLKKIEKTRGRASKGHASAGARAQNSRSACRLRARQVLSRQAARGQRDATHREIAVVRLLAGCGRFKVGRRKFTDWARR